jgi:23S rRNA (uridine2552-2'-O)-methyltransferase
MQSTKVAIKSKKKRTASSRQWLERQLNDPFVEQARALGYRSRAAFKLEEIHQKYKILTKNAVVVDLGAAPGGWTQITKKIVPSATVIGLDLQPYEAITGTEQIIGDFTEEATLETLITCLNGKELDVVLSDMASPSCGIASIDHDRIMGLLELVLDFSMNHLKKGGHMVAKVLRGGTEHNLLTLLKKSFSKVYHFKPDSSRKDSSEMYVVAMGFKGHS